MCSFGVRTRKKGCLSGRLPSSRRRTRILSAFQKELFLPVHTRDCMFLREAGQALRGGIAPQMKMTLTFGIEFLNCEIQHRE